MNCICNTMIELQGFGGYQHYEGTLNIMKNNIVNGFFTKVSENMFEITFQCTKCGQVWKLGIPDFPVQGYFLRSKGI
jgi:hypothetical protein